MKILQQLKTDKNLMKNFLRAIWGLRYFKLRILIEKKAKEKIPFGKYQKNKYFILKKMSIKMLIFLKSLKLELFFKLKSLLRLHDGKKIRFKGWCWKINNLFMLCYVLYFKKTLKCLNWRVILNMVTIKMRIDIFPGEGQ